MAKVNTYDMTEGNPITLLLKFSLPMLIGNIFQQFYNMVDSIIVGQFVGANALAAVGATGAINFLFFSLAFGLSAGIGIIISQYFGAKDEKKVKKSIATSVYIIMGSAIIMGVLMITSARLVMQLLNTPNEIINDCVVYMRVTGIGMIAVGAYNGVAAILRALGDAKTPLIFLIVACFVNIIFDLLFVISFKWGVFGVALATVIAQCVSAIGCIIYAWKKMPIFHMPIREYVMDREIFRKSIKVGIPVALQNALIALSCVVLQSVVNSFGPTIVAAFTVASRFEQLVHQPFNSLGAALGTYTGQNMGANNIKRIKKGFWAGTKIAVIFSLIMLPIACFGGEAIMSLFTTDEAVIIEGAKGIRVTCFFYSGLGMIYITRSVLNGAGDVKFAMISGCVEVICRVGLARPLTFIPAIGMMSIWYTTGLTWLFTAIVSCIRYAHGKWKSKGIIQDSIKYSKDIINEI
ncbi:MAG: MATE family efflux transporter [Cellulosilyticum sp.]|nr:MATE family efflux transporter [Cellulosilyticum sp.]